MISSLSNYTVQAWAFLDNKKAKLDLDPISVLAAVALTAHKPTGTRLSFASAVLIQEPSDWQGLTRYIQGASREDLSIIKNSIIQVIALYKPHKQDDELSKCVKIFLEHVKNGLKNGLGRTYSSSGVTTEALSSWQKLIDNACNADENQADINLNYAKVDEKIQLLWIESEIALMNAYFEKMKQHREPTMQNLEAFLEQKSKGLYT
jgi:hypothetical protein